MFTKKTVLSVALASIGLLAAGFANADPVFNTASVSGQGTWETTLQARDFDGNAATVEGYYDTVLNITWLADVNYAMTTGYDANGTMTWATANSWATSLNLNGITGWRLPAMVDTGTSGCNFAYTGTDCGYNVQTTSGATVYSEMASMFYDTLGNKAQYNSSGSVQSVGVVNTGPFSNALQNIYWSGLGYAPNNIYAWYFRPDTGGQNNMGKANALYAWAVHSGDVGASVVPVPAAVWLFGSGLLGLAGVARRKVTRSA